MSQRSARCMQFEMLRLLRQPNDRLYWSSSAVRWTGLELRDLWAHRELFYFLAWRDVKVRYKQTALGASWAILQPLISMVVFTIALRQTRARAVRGRTLRNIFVRGPVAMELFHNRGH